MHDHTRTGVVKVKQEHWVQSNLVISHLLRNCSRPTVCIRTSVLTTTVASSLQLRVRSVTVLHATVGSHPLDFVLGIERDVHTEFVPVESDQATLSVYSAIAAHVSIPLPSIIQSPLWRLLLLLLSSSISSSGFLYSTFTSTSMPFS